MIRYLLSEDIDNDEFANILDIINQAEEKEETLVIYVNSAGGEVEITAMIAHALMYSNVEIELYAMQAFSAACVLFKMCKSDNIKRYATPMSMFMDHPSVVSGIISKNGINYHEVIAKREEYTNKMAVKSFADTDPDYFFGAEEALKLGIVDEIIDLF
jgi:ATP-dependent protease ClpP protease subunit